MESEKLLEKKLSREIKKLGGWAIKLLPFIISGLPDRLILLPGGVCMFAEIKTTGKVLRPVQKLIIRRLRKLGFDVRVIDTSEGIKKLIRDYAGQK